MLLLMLERDMPIDAVITADAGMEFPEMYEHLSRLDEHLFHERGMDKRAIAQFGSNPLGQFRKDWTVERLEARFAKEESLKEDG